MESPTTVEKPHVAVIGAGMSGLVCASELSARSVPVRVFEKSRGPGGRMSTRRSPSLGRDADFDHGAQYFTVRAPELMGRVEQWMSAGVVAPWHGRIVSIAADGVETSNTRTQRFVGVPSMSAICRHLARGLDVHFDTPVARIEGGARDWRLIDCNGRSLGEFDLVISTAPAPQTAALLERAAPDLADRISHVRMQPCWALLAAFGEPLPVGFDGAFINEGPLSWVARTSSKPGRRSTPERWVLHANPGWSERVLARRVLRHHTQRDASDPLGEGASVALCVV